MQSSEIEESVVIEAVESPITDRMRGYFASGSPIRKMFEEGLRLKKLHGEANVADMSIGNPAFPPPEKFRLALREAAGEPGPHSYMPNAGYPWVRERVAAHLNRNGFFDGITAEHLVMTTGAAGALNVVLAAILEPGDEVIVSRPYFVEYRFYVELHGGVLRVVDCGPSFEIDPAEIGRAITPKTRAVIVNSPNNPTGMIYRRPTLEKLAETLVHAEHETGRRVFLISDEPYRELLFSSERFVSPATLYPCSFMCYSWSKEFSIPGERMGYLAVNPRMPAADWPLMMGSLAMCNRILGFINAPAFMQRVIGNSVDAKVDLTHYRSMRSRLCECMEEAGYVFARPEGAFYVFARTPEPEKDFIERAKRHLLLVVPGSGFGMDDHFRICYAVPDATVELACRKLVEIKREIDES